MDDWVEAMAAISAKGFLFGVMGNLRMAEAEGLFRRLLPGSSPDE
jgi:hypothetical protein